MPIRRLTVWSVALVASFAASQMFAATVARTSNDVGSSAHDIVFAGSSGSAVLSLLPSFDPAPMLAQSAVPSGLPMIGKSASVEPARQAKSKSGRGGTAAKPVAADDQAQADVATSEHAGNAADLASDSNELQKSLIAMAMRLRDIPYARGGRDPSTGFDCSGFVRYVFAHAIGLELPTNSASQFLAGLKVRRDDMQPGDLVFFRTAGRRGKGRISHVGIYVSNGRFIHSPSHGKTVRVDNLSESYWAKRFAGAKRPEGMAQNG